MALFLGSFMLLTFAYSVPAFVLTPKAGARTTHLSVLNTLVILTGCATLAIGSAVWFFTLRQRAEFEAIWKEQSPEGIVLVQDWLKCCGYWTASSEGLFSQATGFCGTTEIAAVSDKAKTPGLQVEEAVEAEQCMSSCTERHARYAMRHAHHRICCVCRDLEQRAPIEAAKRCRRVEAELCTNPCPHRTTP